MAIEIVDLPIENGGSFHSYVNVYQRVVEYTSKEYDHWVAVREWANAQLAVLIGNRMMMLIL
jgi:hypothetical protein